MTLRQPMKPCSPRNTMMGRLISFMRKSSVSPGPGGEGRELAGVWLGGNLGLPCIQPWGEAGRGSLGDAQRRVSDHR